MTHNNVATTSSEESALQLPLDFYRTPSTTSELTLFTLPKAKHACRDYRSIATAWCILLSRYVNDSEDRPQKIRILVNSAGSMEGVLKSQWSDVPIGETVRAHDISATLGHLLQYHAANEHIPVESPPMEGDHCALTFIPPYHGAMENDDPDVILKFLSSVDLKPDINLVVIQNNTELLQSAIIYNKQLFLKSTIERCAGHLEKLSEQLSATPNAPITDLQLLTTEEQTWLNEISRGPVQSNPPLTLSKQFEHQVEQRPGSIALRYRDQRLSYFEVNQRANQLAHYLIERGISAERRVIVCLEPSFETIIALLAIWKAGGCYIPLDPAYPTARVNRIIEETAPDLIITRRDLATKHRLDGLTILVLDEAVGILANRALSNPVISGDPETTASIFFTSGTTGKPKGVMASNSNIAHYISVARDRYAVTENDILPAVARFDFSISIFELMLPLTAGGTLILLDRDHVRNFSRMSRTLEEVTFFHIGPSLLKGIIGYIRQQNPDVSIYSKVRHASSGGDMIPPQVLEDLKEIFTEAEIFVIYGCSEISCMGCTYPVPRTEKVTKTYVGRPFENVTVRILDKKRRMVPPGISGEICFAGGGVVKGYLNQPDLSAAKFVDMYDERFYCTGDIGRVNNAGMIEILGRRDFQVQLRGMRIELGEVEYALRQAPGVQDGIVIARTTSDGEKHLAAFIVPKDEQISSSVRCIGIRAFMTDHLPDFMVPATYTELAALPLNVNMKVDRSALQKMAVPLLESENDVQLPESPTEKRLAALWSTLLDVETIGLDNNFFELGGDSLLALHFIGLVQGEYNLTLEGMEVLREPLEVLARICDQRLGKQTAAQDSRSDSVITESKELFYFGDGSSLFGVLTIPAMAARATTAILICGAHGHEHVRTTFIIHNLIKQAVRLGFPVFRFDYSGCRDALGETRDASCAQWQKDIDTAQKELQHRTGVENIIAVGIRFGATLLLNSSKLTTFSKLILWDPIVKGESYHKELKILHKAYLDAQPHLRFKSRFFSSSVNHELLGVCYSENMNREFHSISIRPEFGEGILTHCLLTHNSISEQSARQSLPANPLNLIKSLPVDCFWQDPAAIEEILPDTGISKAITSLIKGAP